MRYLSLLLWLFIMACSDQNPKDSLAVEVKDTNVSKQPAEIKPTPAQPEIYGNARFRNVTVRKISADTYRLAGEGQIFEASFSWVVEDGHNELKSGYNTTDAGAPAWGKFDFTINVPKEREHSVLHIILYESSAEDGRRTHELPILLE